jgi:hypothetical protein
MSDCYTHSKRGQTPNGNMAPSIYAETFYSERKSA